ncbi:metallophosphoesterase family protein [Paenibacillus sp. 1P07SE]|uniref:metallophosphoesterase family protein n=1 Tax=Paenibacillus sp. 1P07SE TaxID=3132209 RepID=UPI0039A6912E
MNRTIMISDIHGCLQPFQTLLEQVNYGPGADRLILLGDYVDRGPHSKETVDLVMRLVQEHQAVALRGNHDQRLVDLSRCEDRSIYDKFLAYGGVQTLQSYCGLSPDEIDEDALDQARAYINNHFNHHIAFLDSLPLYYEDEHHIYVHAGINPRYLDWREQPAHDFMYIRDEFHRSLPAADKLVVFGHTRTVELHDACDVWYGVGKIGIDGGCAYGMQLNALIYDNGRYDTVYVENPH